MTSRHEPSTTLPATVVYDALFVSFLDGGGHQNTDKEPSSTTLPATVYDALFVSFLDGGGHQNTVTVI